MFLVPLTQYNEKMYFYPKNARKKCIWICLLWKYAANTCLTLVTDFSIEANSVDPDQTAPKGAVWSRSTLLVIEASKH